jgi:hypothetical protein
MVVQFIAVLIHKQTNSVNKEKRNDNIKMNPKEI